MTKEFTTPQSESQYRDKYSPSVGPLSSTLPGICHDSYYCYSKSVASREEKEKETERERQRGGGWEFHRQIYEPRILFT